MRYPDEGGAESARDKAAEGDSHSFRPNRLFKWRVWLEKGKRLGEAGSSRARGEEGAGKLRPKPFVQAAGLAGKVRRAPLTGDALS